MRLAMTAPDVKAGRGDLSWLPGLMSRYEIDAEGVLHIGAHNGEELPVYQECGFSRIVLVEPDLGQALKAQLDNPDVEIMAIAVAPGEPALRGWRREVNTHQSRLEPVDAQPWKSIKWVMTRPLSGVLDAIGRVNVLVVDTAGSELDALSSGPLQQFDLIVVETDDAGTFASPTDAVRGHLADRGFTPVERWTHGAHSYGDEAYVRA